MTSSISDGSGACLIPRHASRYEALNRIHARMRDLRQTTGAQRLTSGVQVSWSAGSKGSLVEASFMIQSGVRLPSRWSKIAITRAALTRRISSRVVSLNVGRLLVAAISVRRVKSVVGCPRQPNIDGTPGRPEFGLARERAEH